MEGAHEIQGSDARHVPWRMHRVRVVGKESGTSRISYMYRMSMEMHSLMPVRRCGSVAGGRDLPTRLNLRCVLRLS